MEKENFRNSMAISDLEYVEKEKEKEYQCTFGFFSVGWQKWNRIILIFNEKGEFVRTKTYMYHEFEGTTMEETEGEHIIKVMRCKKTIQDILHHLTNLKEKEEIVFQKETYDPELKQLAILFQLGKMEFSYRFINNDKIKEEIEYVCKKSWDTFFINMENIPSLKGIGEKIRNHPKIRIKYVNELIYLKDRA